MPARKFEHLSNRLKDVRNRLAEFRHGGILFNSEQVELFVEQFDEFIDMARALEKGDRVDPAIVDVANVAIIGNVVAFPCRAPDNRPTGGAA